MKWGWRYLLNIDTIAAICLIIAVVYCLFTKKKRKVYEFRGMGNGGWNISEGSNFWDYGISQKKQKQPRKLNKHEEKCRKIFQNIFGDRFKSVRPDWLKNPVTGKNLELDGFCESVRTPMGKGLAFEYDGAQHAKYNKHFHRGGPDEFVYQTKKDSWKDIRCKQKGVMLIRIPHFVAYEDLERYITDKLGKLRMLPRNNRKETFRPRSHDEEYERARSSSSNSTRYSWTSEKGMGFLSGLYN